MDRTRDRDEAIKWARVTLQASYVVMDTETTGLTEPEACSIAIVNKDGQVWESLVRPSKTIEASAMGVHHITNEMVASAPSLRDCMKDMADFMGNATTTVIYNAKFDTAVVRRSIPEFSFGVVVDAMQICAAFFGDWDSYHGNYKWPRLGVALDRCGLKPNGNLHGAAVDAYMTRELLKYIAEQKLSTEKEQ